MKCENEQHEKIFASFCYPTSPPQYPWICKKCGEKGIDKIRSMLDEYEMLKKKFSKEKYLCLPLERL